MRENLATTTAEAVSFGFAVHHYYALFLTLRSRGCAKVAGSNSISSRCNSSIVSCLNEPRINELIKHDKPVTMMATRSVPIPIAKAKARRRTSAN